MKEGLSTGLRMWAVSLRVIHWPASSFCLVSAVKYWGPSPPEVGRGQWVRLTPIGTERALLGKCRWGYGTRSMWYRAFIVAHVLAGPCSVLRYRQGEGRHQPSPAWCCSVRKSTWASWRSQQEKGCVGTLKDVALWSQMDQCWQAEGTSGKDGSFWVLAYHLLVQWLSKVVKLQLITCKIRTTTAMPVSLVHLRD